MKVLFSVIICLIILVPAASAQNWLERTQNVKQVKQGKRNLARDVKELDWFRAKVNEFRLAFDVKNSVKTNDLLRGLLIDMRREIGQTELKVLQAKKEKRSSSRELRSDRRELRRDYKDDDSSRYDKGRDRRDKRDDRRDLKDDIKDVKTLEGVLENQKRILNGFLGYSFNFDGDMPNTKRASLINFMGLMEKDLELTKAELKEDTKERREDRRETRDDRRSRYRK